MFSKSFQTPFSFCCPANSSYVGSGDRQAHEVITTEVRLIISLKDKSEEWKQSDTSNKILPPSMHHLNTNLNRCKQHPY